MSKSDEMPRYPLGWNDPFSSNYIGEDYINMPEGMPEIRIIEPGKPVEPKPVKWQMEVINLIDDDKLVSAVKRIREETGLLLQESLDMAKGIRRFLTMEVTTYYQIVSRETHSAIKIKDVYSYNSRAAAVTEAWENEYNSTDYYIKEIKLVEYPAQSGGGF